MGVIFNTLDFNFTTATATLKMAAGNNTITAANTNATTLNVTLAAMTIASRGCQNGSLLCDCASHSSANATHEMSDEGSLDALLYIVVVLLFYAFSIVVLMVKYIRRENKEAYLRQYFDEFVARDQFQSPQARNQMCMKNIMDRQNQLTIKPISVPTTDVTDRDKLEDQKCVSYYIPQIAGNGSIEEEEEEEEEEKFELALCDFPQVERFIEVT